MSSIRQHPPLWAQPIPTRPRTLPTLNAILAILALNVGILSTFGLLVLLLPLRLVRTTRPLYGRLGKGAFGAILITVVQLVAPTEMVVTAGDGVAKTDWVHLDEAGEITSIRLPDKGVWTSNHTTLVDWVYLWPFSYLSGHHASLFICLKASLRRIPIIGWSCNLLNFVFLDRKWETDRQNFRHQLGRITRTTLDGGEKEKAALLIFPEGTITTENTRGISARYAEKTGVRDYKYLLLPRSTGLFYSLRHLAISLPSLSLVDLTVGYPVPRTPASTSPSSPLFASDFYDIASVLIFSVPAPELHIHLRTYRVADIPLGDLDALKKDPEAECSEEERKAFEEWLRERWEEKDALLERFRKEGSFVEPAKKGAGEDEEEDDDRRPGEYVWRPHLRQAWEYPAAFSFLLPFAAGYFAYTSTGKAVGAVKAALFGGAGKEVIKSCGCGKAAEKAVQTATRALEEL
ncbi:hypothetical protein JCM8097_001686 [Rhodosporidiobolus ruineniae]